MRSSRILKRERTCRIITRSGRKKKKTKKKKKINNERLTEAEGNDVTKSGIRRPDDGHGVTSQIAGRVLRRERRRIVFRFAVAVAAYVGGNIAVRDLVGLVN